MHELSTLAFEGAASWCYRTMGTIGVIFDIEVGHKTTGVTIRCVDFINIDNGTEFVEPQHFPRALIVEFLPTHVLDVTKSEKAVCGRFGWEALPGLVLVPGTAECDDAGDLCMLG